MKRLQLLFIAGCLLCGSALHAETRALLIGVSGYPSLPSIYHLSGPRNDVMTMATALRHQGITDITVLADGVAVSRADPTRAAIFTELSRLAQVVKQDDWVVIYFSGHGSQQPQPAVLPPGTYVEPDGLDEIFLPLDVAHWDTQTGTVANGMIDDEIGHAIGAILRRGASVWAIFDTCHAGDMVKSLPTASQNGVTRVWRMVPPNVLGVPPRLPVRGMHRTRAPAPTSSPVAKTLLGNLHQGQLVAFYATKPEEPAAEESLMAGHTGNRMTGVFTWYLAAVMEEHGKQPRISFATLMDAVTARYHADNRVFPNPFMEGPGMLEMKFDGKAGGN